MDFECDKTDNILSEDRMKLEWSIVSSASAERLERLIAERIAPGADRQLIDQRIWDLFGETWSVMFTDLSGFSRQVAEFGIIHFLQTIHESRRLFVPVIDSHEGILLKHEGDSMLVIFRNPRKALECAVAMRDATARYNEARPATDHILLCVGLGHGPVLRIGDQDMYGAEVNASSKLGEDMARANEILVTANFRDAVDDPPGISFESLSTAPAGAESAFRVLFP